MSPSHTRRRGRVYRYYVTREAIADGYESCPIASVPAADVEGAVLDHLQKLLTAPELVARTWAVARREDDETPSARSRSCSPNLSHSPNSSRSTECRSRGSKYFWAQRSVVLRNQPADTAAC
jgi:hypothetical protein